MINNKNTGFYRIGAVFFLFCCFVFVPFINGCSSFSHIKKKTKGIVREINFLDENLKKKVWVTSFDNRSSWKAQNFNVFFREKLVETIKSTSSQILLIDPKEEGYSDHLPTLSSGGIDNFALAKHGRLLGLNAIVTGYLADLSAEQKKRGLWWFRDTHYYLQMRIVMEVYDTETAAKLIDEDFVHKVEVDETTYQTAVSKKDENIPEIDNAFVHAANVLGEKICDAVGVEPWKGYIISKADDRLTISSGRRSGLGPGDILKVYEIGTIIEGTGGYRFFGYGHETGEIKLTDVSSDTAEGIQVSGEVKNVGCMVRFKK